MRGSWSILALLGISVLAVLVYAPGLGFYFVADDFRYLELAAEMRGLSDMLPHLQGSCTRVGWPAVVFVFWIARTVGGMQPVFYRLFPLAIHVINALLAFVLVRRLVGSKETVAALAAALAVALHPRQHESVMWLSSLTWPAGTMFTLLGAIGYVAWRQSGRNLWLAVVAVSVVLAMISNPSIVVLPFIFAAYDVLRRRWDRMTVLVCAGLITVVLLLSLLCGLGSLPNSGERSSYGLGLSGVSHIGVFLTYILWPLPLNLKDILATTPLAGYAAIGLSVTVMGAAGLLILWRGTLLARWGVVWAALTLLPPAFFSTFISDRYMSVMLVGVGLACAGLVQGSGQRWTRVVLTVAVLWTAFALPQLMIKMDDWRAASHITAAVRDETLARYPQVSDHTRFYYVGLPDMVRRSVTWSQGIDSAVRLWYNNPTLGAHRNIEFGVPITPGTGDTILDFTGRWEN